MEWAVFIRFGERTAGKTSHFIIAEYASLWPYGPCGAEMLVESKAILWKRPWHGPFRGAWRGGEGMIEWKGTRATCGLGWLLVLVLALSMPAMAASGDSVEAALRANNRGVGYMSRSAF